MIVNPDFVVLECCLCGVLFGLSSKLTENRRETGRDVCCPNGHRIQLDKEGRK